MEEVKINTRKWFWMFCVLHIILWTVLPTIFLKNIYMDSAESVAWGLQWQLGYAKHPPLTGWLAGLFTNLGPYLNMQLYFLGTLLVIITFWAVWKLANRILSPVQALISVMLLECAIYYNCFSVNITPDISQIPCWALTFLTFYIALKEQKIYQWVLTGICCALSFYAKYQAGLIFLPMTFFVLFTAEGRKSFLKPGIYFCVIVFLICIAPHIYWSYQDNFTEITYALNSTSDAQINTGYNIIKVFLASLNFLAAQVAFTVLLIIAILIFLFAKKDKEKSIGKFNKQFLLIMGVGPLFIACMYPFITGSVRVLPRWGYPCFSLAGIIAMAWIKPVITKQQIYKFLSVIFGILFIISFGYCITYGYLTSYAMGNYRPWAYFPGKHVADKVTEIWHSKYGTKLKYVAGQHYLTCYITAYSDDHPVPYLDWNKKEAKWINIDSMKKNGAIFVWWIVPSGTGEGIPKKGMLEEAFKRFPHAEKIGSLKFEKIGIPLGNTEPFLRTFAKKYFPEVIFNRLNKDGWFPNFNKYVEIGVAILPPEKS